MQFIGRYLKPGGVVYLKLQRYARLALRPTFAKILVEHAALNPNRSDIQIHQAAQFVDKLQQLNAGFITANPGLKPRPHPNYHRHYLVHEYMHRHWQPGKIAIDVANDLADAKLDYIGSADLPLAYRQNVFNTRSACITGGNCRPPHAKRCMTIY